jgi:murein DD-endopeptidase MepM/ murein hydrolase activator NlpD
MGQAAASSSIGGTGGGTGGNSGGMFDSSLIESGHKVNSYWGEKRVSKTGKVRYHGGTDYQYSSGSPVRAIADGKVTNAVTGKKNAQGSGTLGNQVSILHTAGNGQTYSSVYGHLSTVSVTKGQQVKKGDVIGKSGNTGDSDGPHLHFELRKGKWTTGAGWKAPSSWITMEEANKILPSGSVNDVEGGTDQSSTDNLSVTDTSSGSTSESALLAEAGKLNLAKDYTAPISQFQAKGERSLNLLKGLYSGKTEDIMSSMQSLSANMGVTGEMWNYFTNNSSDYTNAPGNQQGPGGGFKPGSPVNNNVSIVVQVPDVTAADATKFAQLVKSYLDEDSLLSSTGGA